MTLSEKLFMLRKKNGLSQEQLAEQLGVSRQAISKWESGQSVPENEKMIAISNYFQVSLDYLMKDSEPQEQSSMDQTTIPVITSKHHSWIFGMFFCILGTICLVIWGVVSVLNSTTSEQISNSSMITINGSGVLLSVSVIFIAVGAILVLIKLKQR